MSNCGVYYMEYYINMLLYAYCKNYFLFSVTHDKMSEINVDDLQGVKIMK